MPQSNAIALTALLMIGIAAALTIKVRALRERSSKR
jgi:hypothetical protein